MRKAVCSVALAASLAATTVFAEVERDEAKIYFDAGVEAFEAAHYLAAIQAFERAYRLAPHPALVFSMAQARRKQFYVDDDIEQARQAVELYRTYLVQVPQGGRRADAAQALGELGARLAGATSAAPTPTAPKRQTRVMVLSSHTQNAKVALDGGTATPTPLIREVSAGKHSVTVSAAGYFDEQRDVVAVEGELVATDAPLRERPSQLSVAGPRGAELSVDSRPVGALPLAALELDAGRHVVTLAKSGREPWSSQIELGRGENKTIRAQLAMTTQRRVATGLFVLAGAGALTAGGFGVVALHAQSVARDVEDEAKTHNLSLDRVATHDDAVARRDDFRRAAWITLGVAGALGVGALVLYATDPGAPRVSLSPVVGSGFAGFAVSGRL